MFNKNQKYLAFLFIGSVAVLVVSMILGMFDLIDNSLQAYGSIAMFFILFMMRYVDVKDNKDLLYKGADYFQMCIWAGIILSYSIWALFQEMIGIILFVTLAAVMMMHFVIEAKLLHRKVEAKVDKMMLRMIKKRMRQEREEIEEMEKNAKKKPSRKKRN